MESGTGAFRGALYDFVYFDQYLSLVVYSVLLTRLPEGPTTFGVSRCSQFSFLLCHDSQIFTIHSCMQEDGDGHIFIGTSTSTINLIRGTNVLPQPTKSPTGVPTSPTMSPTKTPTFSPISVGVTCPPSYEHTKVLSSDVLMLDYSVVREEAPHNGMIHCCPFLDSVCTNLFETYNYTCAHSS